jgi:cation transport ATPase
VPADPQRRCSSGLAGAWAHRGAGALERLGGARTVLLDKTGTLTLGQPELERIVTLGHIDADETLRLAASLDQMSAHVLAESLVDGAVHRGIELSLPTGVKEEAGRGIIGDVDGHRVAVGSSAWLEANGYDGVRDHARAHDDGDAPATQDPGRVDGALEP